MQRSTSSIFRRRLLALGSTVTFQSLLVGCALAAPASFSGHWMYQQTCGWQHVATLDLKQAGNTVTGKWSDGTRLRGSEGSLQGELRGGTLYAKFCGIDESSGYPTCPKLGAEVTDHFVRRGDVLTWYQGSGSQFDKYLVLHLSVNGKASFVDADCSNDAE